MYLNEMLLKKILIKARKENKTHTQKYKQKKTIKNLYKKKTKHHNIKNK